MSIPQLIGLIIAVAVFSVMVAPIEAFINIGKAGTSSPLVQTILDLYLPVMAIMIVALIWRGGSEPQPPYAPGY